MKPIKVKIRKQKIYIKSGSIEIETDEAIEYFNVYDDMVSYVIQKHFDGYFITIHDGSKIEEEKPCRGGVI